MTNRELDALVAQEVMGFERLNDHWRKNITGRQTGCGTVDYDIMENLPHYSTDISAAFDALSKADYFRITKDSPPPYDIGTLYSVEVIDVVNRKSNRRMCRQFSDFPKLMVKVLLKAKGVECGQ